MRTPNIFLNKASPKNPEERETIKILIPVVSSEDIELNRLVPTPRPLLRVIYGA